MKEYIPLGEVITKSSVERCGGNQYPILSITMKDGLVLQDEKFKKRIASVDTSEYKVIPRGKLVQGIHIDEANFGIQDIVDAGIVSPAYKVWDVNDRRIFPKYLEIIMRSPRSIGFYKSKLNGSVNRRGRMTDDDFLGMLIPIVHYSEQMKIVDTLNRVKEVITKRAQELALLDDLIKARFVEMFGDPISNTKQLETDYLKDVLVLKAGDFTSASDISEEPSTLKKYPCYGGNGIRGYVAEYNHEGDYSLIGRQGALSGNVQYATGRFKNTEHALLVSPSIPMNSIWLNKLLINLDLKRYQTGAAQPGLSVKNLQEIKIISVPLEEQNKYASFVSQVDKSKSAIQRPLIRQSS